jgi:hypothetical protein
VVRISGVSDQFGREEGKCGRFDQQQLGCEEVKCGNGAAEEDDVKSDGLEEHRCDEGSMSRCWASSASKLWLVRDSVFCQ